MSVVFPLPAKEVSRFNFRFNGAIRNLLYQHNQACTEFVSMDDKVKEIAKIGAIAGCSTVMVYELGYYFTLERGSPATIGGIFLGILFGLVVGGIAGGIAFFMKRDD